MSNEKKVNVSTEDRYSLVLVYYDDTEQMIFEPSPLIVIDRMTQKYKDGEDFIKNGVVTSGLFSIRKPVKEIKIKYPARNKIMELDPIYDDDILISKNDPKEYEAIEKDLRRLCIRSMIFAKAFLSPYYSMYEDTSIKLQAEKVRDACTKAYDENNPEDTKYFISLFCDFLETLKGTEKGKLPTYRLYRDWYTDSRNFRINLGEKDPIDIDTPLYDPQIKFDELEKGHTR